MKLGKTATTTKQTSNKKWEPLPNGQYLATLSKLQEKQTKAGTGTYLEATFKIKEGDHKNRLIFHKFHLDNPNVRCKEIGIDQLNKFLRCIGVKGGLADLDFDTTNVYNYIGSDVALNMKIEKGTGGYSDRNKITSFAVR